MDTSFNDHKGQKKGEGERKGSRISLGTLLFCVLLTNLFLSAQQGVVPALTRISLVVWL